MSNATEETCLRNRTAAIRHLDADDARRLVAAFQRPAIVGGRGVVSDAADPVTEETQGHLQVGRVPGHERTPTVVGHYQTHLRLQGLERVPLSVARELARHRGHLYLDKVAAITPATAAALAVHEGGGLSLAGIELLTEDVARQLVGHPNLSLGGVRSVTDRVAAILAGFPGASLVLGGLREASGRAVATLLANPAIDLPQRLRDPATAPERGGGA